MYGKFTNVAQVLNELLATLHMGAVLAPRADYQCRIFRDSLHPLGVLNPDIIGLAVLFHLFRIGVPKRKYVGHTKRSVAPSLGEINATADGGIVNLLIGCRWIQADELNVSILGNIPARENGLG